MSPSLRITSSADREPRCARRLRREHALRPARVSFRHAPAGARAAVRGSQSTTSTRSKRSPRAGFDQQRDRDDGVGPGRGVAAFVGERADGRMRELLRAIASLGGIREHALRAARARSRVPSGRQHLGPKCPAICASSGDPGATTSRASRSVSMIVTPSAANRLATVLLPLAMPPVRPTAEAVRAHALSRRANRPR